MVASLPSKLSTPVKSQSYACLHAVSPSQVTARKLVRKYSSNSRLVGQRRELSSLRLTLPHMKTASDLDLVLGAIDYIQQLQHKLVSSLEEQQGGEKEKQGEERLV